MLTEPGKELFEILYQYPLLHIKRMIHLIEEHPRLLLEQDKEGRTALHITVEKRHYTGILHFILDKGCALNMQDNHGITPLFLAVKLGYPEIVMALINRGACINITDNQKRSVLHVAVKGLESNFNPKIVSALLKAGMNPRVPDLYGLTSMGIIIFYAAINKGDTTFVRLLFDYSVDLRLKEAGEDQLLYYLGLKKATCFLSINKKPAYTVCPDVVFREHLLEVIALSLAAAHMHSVSLGRFRLDRWVNLPLSDKQRIYTYLTHILTEAILEKAILQECILQSPLHRHADNDSVLAARLFARCSEEQMIELVSYSMVYGVGAVALYPRLLEKHPMHLVYESSQLSTTYTNLFYIIQRYAQQTNGVELLLEQIKEDKKHAAFHAASISENLFKMHIESDELPAYHPLMRK
jgi:hypothetical protein